MKKQIILLLSMLFLGTMALQAQFPIQVSGTVTNEITGDPIPNHDVYIMVNDSSIYYSTIPTNQAGFYIDTIMPGGFIVNSVYIITNDLCTYGIHDTLIQNPGSVIQADFEICADTIPGPDCQADFFFVPDSNSQYIFSFYDLSTSVQGVNSWFWEFGDGTSSTSQSPVHAYNAPGTYQVCLTIVADSGTCTSTACEFLVVSGGLNCHADFVFIADSSQNNTVYFFDQSFSTGPINTYLWSFGDGNSSVQQNPVHAYANPGTYNVCLTIESLDSGLYCTDTYCMDVVVQGSGGDCVADFYYYQDSTQDYTIYFQDLSTPANTITSYSWYFGDGNSSIVQNPVHTYAGAGTYNVCLSIISQYAGMVCTDTYCMDVVVTGSGGIICEADFIYTYDTLGSSSNIVNFFDMSTPVGMIDSWSWDFGDGLYSSEQNPVHTYAAAGSYNVCLTITADSMSCTSTHCDTIFINVQNQFQLGGNVFAGMYQLDHGFAYGYKSENGIITEVYSEMIDTLGYYVFYPLLAADYYAKAEPAPSSSYFGQFVPTYYGDVVSWSDAVLLNLTQNIYTADINLVPVSVGVYGPGSISGTIMMEGDDKGQTPAVDVQLMLRNEAGDYVGLAYSDENGNFEFLSLSHGTFTLMAEVMGVDMIPRDYVLSADNETIEDVSLIMNEDEIYFGPSGIETLGSISVGEIYPNPVNNELKINISVVDQTSLTVNIVNQLGQAIVHKEQVLNNDEIIILNTSKLEPGLYYLKIISQDQYQLTRRFIKL